MDTEYDDVYTDGAGTNNQYAEYRRAGAGVYFEQHSEQRDVSVALAGLSQTNQRGELSAVIFAREGALKKQRVHSDSEYVLDNREKALAAGPAGIRHTRMDNEDLWERYVEVESAALHPAEFHKVKGHATVADVASGRVRPQDKYGNDKADDRATGGAAQHALSIGGIRVELEQRRKLRDVQRMMVAIAMARARREKEIERLAAPGDEEDGDQPPDGTERYPWHNGLGRVAASHDVAAVQWPGAMAFHWGAGAWCALLEYFREVRWLDISDEDSGMGTSWVELAVDFELFSGLSLRLLNASSKKAFGGYGGSDVPWGVGQKATCLNAMVRKAKRTLGSWPFPGDLVEQRGGKFRCEALRRLGGGLCAGLQRRVCFRDPETLVVMRELATELYLECRALLPAEKRIAYSYIPKRKQWVPGGVEGVAAIPQRWGVEPNLRARAARGRRGRGAAARGHGGADGAQGRGGAARGRGRGAQRGRGRGRAAPAAAE